jgi:hypothetical protein
MADRCNRCRIGVPEFQFTLVTKKDGKVYHRYRCTMCNNVLDRPVNPIGFDLHDPRAQRTLLRGVF